MEVTSFPTAIEKFVQQVTRFNDDQVRPLTINDLRLGIRSERISEISGWSNQDLDVIEVHAAGFDGNEPLESVLSLPAETALPGAVTASSICCYSPFAWT